VIDNGPGAAVGSKAVGFDANEWVGPYGSNIACRRLIVVSSVSPNPNMPPKVVASEVVGREVVGSVVVGIEVVGR